MARPTAGGNSGNAGTAHRSLSNVGYFSDYFLAHRLTVGLGDLFARWDAAEKLGEPTERTRLRALSTALARLRPDAALTAPAGDVLDTERLDLGQLPADGRDALLALNDAILDALGWTPNRDAGVEFTSGGKGVVVPVAHRCDTPTGVLLIALDTVFATDPAAVIAGKTAPAGRLIAPILVNGAPAAHTALDAAQLIFTADDAPSYILFVSGGAITLLDRDRWGEGISLGANLDEALARHDSTPKGELAAIAGLFSASAINPASGAQSVLDRLRERAMSESAGVSKELRHGIRRSIELLANAVVEDIRYRQKGAWTTIDPRELTRQSLRYLYRIIVLLFAEARPELGILPSDDPDYQAGYSMARLRDTALVELHGEHARNARHLQRSLDILFLLVNDGHAAEQTLGDDDARELTFPALRSALFGPIACPLIDQAQLNDEILQQVIANLCFTPERAGGHRQAISYSTLGINQLGAVYEGLMAYSGFLATEPLFQVDKDADPDNGSWVIPIDRADEFPEEVFLTKEGRDGFTKRVRYEEGEFVFRLSGRDRQRSASYYTPEVLTEFTVRHALDVIFEENPGMRAADILQLTVCEPALGSGAFLNEAVKQLAERYLKAAQDESGDTIDSERYQFELQRAKAHFAANQAYGVDLNQTAVELAEVSLWLGCMHAGLQAPWFGARLRTGNSLVGARRATYAAEEVRGAAWTGKNPKPPTDCALAEVPLGTATGIHHFLVPGEGWGAACDAKEVKELDPDWVLAVKAWRRKIHAKPNQRQLDRLGRLAARVEELWSESTHEVDRFWEATRQHIDVWGADTPATGHRFGEQAIRQVLSDPRSATSRLRTLMDAWCSLWIWAPEQGTGLPSLDEWLTVAEALVRMDEPWERGVLFGDDRELPLSAITSIDDICGAHPWLARARDIASAQSWFHWELEFSPVFGHGGFDLQVGNPPWVRPEWADDEALAELDGAFGVLRLDPESRATRRRVALSIPRNRAAYTKERAENWAMNAYLGSTAAYPILAGVGNNLYIAFLVRALSNMAAGGAVGLLHPDGHLGEPAAARLRAFLYTRYRAYFHFINELQLFGEISHTRPYGVHIYGSEQERVSYTQACFLYHPAVVDRSQVHDGTGELPGMQYIDGGWDVRPHAARLLRVTDATLLSWAALMGSSQPRETRPVRTVTAAEQGLLERLAQAPTRIKDQLSDWIPGLSEQKSLSAGLLLESSADATTWGDAVLQGPHLGLCNPIYQASVDGLNQQDYVGVDPGVISSGYVPKTSLRTGDYTSASRVLRRNDLPSSHYRLLSRKMIPANTWRSLFSAIVPAETTFASVCYAGEFATERDLVLATGLLNSLVADYFARAIGAGAMIKEVTERFPMFEKECLEADLIIDRVLRLNCLTDAFAPLWERHRGSVWNRDVAARSEHSRWTMLIEVDVLVASALNITVEQLAAAYRAQFPVLCKYEHRMCFDTEGRQLCGDWHQHGYLQASIEAEAKAAARPGWTKAWDRVQRHRAGETGVDLGPFVPPFWPADRVGAMTHAYWTFVDRYGLTPSDGAERPA